MRSPAYLQFDESNGALYAWVGYITDHREDQRIDLYVFPTLGHAQAFYKPFVGEWKQDQPGGKWFAKFKYKAPGYESDYYVELRQLLYMGDDKCGTDSGVVPLGEKK